MSILNGKVDNSKVYAIDMPYGSKLQALNQIEQAVFFVAGMEDILICGGVDRLCLYRIGADGSVQKLSELAIPGTVRQLSVCNGFVYVSARDAGVFVCDLRLPEAPVLAAIIDSMELATGICAAGNVLAITNRHMGCELYDIQDPYHPVYCTAFMCGEAQSVWLYDQYAVIGDWVNKQAAIYDITNPAAIQQLSEVQVDGFADGVCVFEREGRNILLVATGHHSRRLENRRKYHLYEYVTAEMIADGYGCGHGIEIFDITIPEQPVRLSGLKTPLSFSGPDTWLVYTNGTECVFTDSVSGVFVICLEQLSKPYFTGFYRLKPLARQKLAPPCIQVHTGAITGAACVNGYLCTASMEEGVHILDTKLSPFTEPRISIGALEVESKKNGTDIFYKSSGQIHSFVQLADGADMFSYNARSSNPENDSKGRIYCACGTAGIEILRPDGSLLQSIATKGICYDLCEKDGYIVTAEGRKGAAVYKRVGDTLQEISRLHVPGNVRQVVAVPDGICCEIDCNKVTLLGFSDGWLEEKHEPIVTGLLYHRHLARTLADDYVVAQTLTYGPVLIPMKKFEKSACIRFGSVTCAFEEGACGYDGKLIVIKDEKYACLDHPQELENFLEGKKVSGAELKGMPFVVGDTLVLLNRCTGTAECLDISDPHEPKFISRTETAGYAEFCGNIGGKIYVASGHGGMIALT